MFPRVCQTIAQKVSKTTRQSATVTRAMALTLSTRSEAVVASSSSSSSWPAGGKNLADAAQKEDPTTAWVQAFTLAVSDPLWSNGYSFASPEADFASFPQEEKSK